MSEAGDDLDCTTGCLAAYVVEARVRTEQFHRDMPLTVRIGIIVAGGRLDKKAWDEATTVVADCMVTFVTNRGGGSMPGVVHGRLPAGYMSDDVAVNDLHMIIYYAPSRSTLGSEGKMQKMLYPVVWIKCRHATSSGGKRDRQGKRKDGPQHKP